MPNTLPSSQKLQGAYPNFVNSRFVKRMIGGGIDDVFDMATRVALWETQGPMHLPAAGR